MTKNLSWLSFGLGALIVLWMGTAFMGSNLLALLITGAIAGVYVLGFSELMAYQKDSLSLNQTLARADTPVVDLNAWLNGLSPRLQMPVQQRITQERSLIPTPVLTPYLVGLLVMLGLIGTFIGMVDTLKGAVIALESNSELEAIRSGLAAPMKGLGMAFGTSVAGVSASAALGLIATLSRRDRLTVWRRLEAEIPTRFASFSSASQRQRTYHALQQQADQWPTLLDRLGQLADRLEGMGQNVTEALKEQQVSVLTDTAKVVTEMAGTMQASLQSELEATTRQMSTIVEPVVERVLSQGQEQWAAAHSQWQATSEAQLAQQLAAVKETTTALQSDWQVNTQRYHEMQSELAEQQRGWIDRNHTQLEENLTATQGLLGKTLADWLEDQKTHNLQRETESVATNQRIFDALHSNQEKHNALLEQQNHWAEEIRTQLTANLKDTQQSLGETLQGWLAEQQRRNQERETEVSTSNQRIFDALHSNQERHTELLSEQKYWAEEIRTQLVGNLEKTQQSIGETLQLWLTEQQEKDQERQQVLASGNQQIMAEVLEQQKQQGELLAQQRQWTEATHQQLTSSIAQNESTISTALASWLEHQQANDQQRLDAISTSNQQLFNKILDDHQHHLMSVAERQSALTESIQAVVAGGESLMASREAMEQQWAERHQTAVAEFIQVAREELNQLHNAESERGDAAVTRFDNLQAAMSEQLASLTQALQEPLTELLNTAAESPKAAAEVLSQLRQEMSSALERDNQMLQERQSIMVQLDQLATSLATATSEQRDAILSMTEASGQMLASVSEKFTAKIDADIDKLTAGIDGVTASSIEMTTLAETFAEAVQSYHAANIQMLDHFASLETQILAMNDRSDEQMAYYVAQAREIIDHSLSSQQEMIEQLRRLSRETAAAN